MSTKKIVNNPKNWTQMDGETFLEKRLNSLLTVSYVGSRNMPSDACLIHALNIIEVRAQSLDSVSEYLEGIFDFKPSQKLLDEIEKIYEKWNVERQTSTSFQ